jgi:small subunit ribosomal protein S4
MSRYTGPKARINRRFNCEIFLSCKAVERKPYFPGIHGSRLRRKVREYGIGLNEKQKLRDMYGLTEKQFRLTFKVARSERGVTSELFMRFLEMRLDSVVYLLGFARTRRAARQLVCHGHITVNNLKVDIPSYRCLVGDAIGVYAHNSSKKYVTQNLDDCRYCIVPAWITLDSAALKGKIEREPIAEELKQKINGQLIVEFYSC